LTIIEVFSIIMERGKPMNFKILAIFLALFSTQMTLADTSETIAVKEIIKGDTFVGINYKGVSKIYHIAGIDCAEIDTQDGRNAKAYATRTLLNKQIWLTVTVDAGTHALAWASQGEGGSGSDIGSLFLSNGICWYRNQSADQLRVTQDASYELLQNKAKYAKLGIWKNGMYFSSADPDSWRSLEVYKYKQQYVNGATNPTLNDANRPATAPASVTSSATNYMPAQPAPGNNGGDWRVKIGH
jgi:endonuclease YncB( thermonuclease family)